MTKDELQQLDQLLVKFAALILNRPYTGKNDDAKNNYLFGRITWVRGKVHDELAK